MLLLLTACFAPDARSYADYLMELERLETDTAIETDTDTDADADTDTDTDTDVDTDVPLFEACSEPTGDGRTVQFSNGASFPVDLYYVNPDCSTQNVVLLAPGDTSDRFTFEGDVWRTWDAFGGTGWVAEVRIDAQSPEWVMAP